MDRKWCIAGKYVDGSGGGVLYWCASEEEARFMLPIFQADPTVRDVRIDYF